MTTDDKFARLWLIAQTAAGLTRNRFPNAVARDELQQEAITWLMSHPDRVKHHSFSDGSIYGRGLILEVQGVLSRLCRNEMNEATGVFPADQYAYQESLIEVLLPGVWDENYRPVSPSGEKVSASTDPAEGNNFSVAVCDVRRAMAHACTIQEMRSLYLHAALALTWVDAQEFSGIGRETLRTKYREGIHAIAVFLNDQPMPERDDHGEANRINEAMRRLAPVPFEGGIKDPDYDGPGARHAMTNATARAVTSGDYEEDQ